MEHLIKGETTPRPPKAESTETTHYSASRVRRILQMGTEAQIEAMKEALASQGKTVEDILGTGANKKNETEKTHWDKVWSKERARDIDPEKFIQLNLQSFRQFCKTKTRRRQARPAGITRELIKTLLWDRYADLVWKDNKIDLGEVSRKGRNPLPGNLKQILSGLVNWLGGFDGAFDPDKGLYLFGTKGNGKSTLLEAAASVSQYLELKFDWPGRSFGYTSLSGIFLETQIKGSLNAVNGITTDSWALDDLKPEYSSLKYYGQNLYLLSELILARYAAWRNSGAFTLIASNMNPQELFDIPGFEVDKCFEIMNRIEVKTDGLNFRDSAFRAKQNL